MSDDAWRLALMATKVESGGTLTSAAMPTTGSHTHPGLYADPNHTHAGGAHPDVTAHVTLGLAPAHAHDFSPSGHDHAGVYEPTHSHPFAASAHNHDGTYSPTHAHPYSADSHAHTGVYEPVHGHPYAATGHNHDGTYSASAHAHTGVYEAAGAVSAHASAGDPHPTYLTAAEGNAAYAVTGHTHAGGSSPWTLVMKTADESKNNLAAVANDTVLQFTTTANTAYHIRLRAFFLTNATADLKYRLVHGGTTTRVRRRVFRTATTDIAQTIELKTAFDAADVVLSTTGLNPWLEEDIVLQVGASGGLLALQWAQGTSNAGPTTCLEGSYLEYALS